MTATPAQTNGFAPISSSASPIPPSGLVPLAASAQLGRGQFACFDASGNVALNDGTVPNLVSAGQAFPEPFSDSSATAGYVRTSVWWGFGAGAPASTVTADGFTKADMGVPFWIKDENTPGKKSNHSGSNRSLGGLVFGVDEAGNPIVWSGPVAHLLARATLLTQSFVHASYTLSDAAASTTTAERTMRRAKVHGVVTSIEFVGAAVAADNTDYVTITISKRDGAGGGAVVLGTYDSRAANQGAVTAFVPAAFSLSAVAGALNLLESDEVTITVAKGGSGKALTGEVRVNGKAI